MRFPPGTRLGPYELQALLGAGGMGEVYRARDTRLDRTVAIKVLSSKLVESANLKQRFEREARALSSLSHPHICTLYDIGNDRGTDFLVMEYLEGETLAARLEKGAMPTDQLLRVAVNIADALDKAHRQGIIHRDLKPGNIMLTKSGAKVLDFGLAKPVAPAASVPGWTGGAEPDAPTVSQPLTMQGVVVGTFQYVAPEQLEGKDADPLTDIFSFGAVLFEMATGRKAFSGRTQASVIAAVISREPPPVSSLQPAVPPGLERVIKVCLSKDRNERFQTAHDLKLDLEWIAEGAPAPIPTPGVARTRRQERLLWASTAVLLAAALILALLHLLRPQKQEALRFLVPPPENTSLDESFAVSPDGRKLAFTSTGPRERPMLYLRSLDQVAARPVPGTEGAERPFWSSESRMVAFFAGRKLKKVDTAGGLPETLCDSSNLGSGSWNQKGVILFGGGPGEGIVRVSEAGGVPQPVTRLDPAHGEYLHAQPQFLPDGDHFLYFSWSAQPYRRWISTGSLGSGQTTRLVNVNSTTAYAPPRYLLFVREGALMAQPFDAGRLRLTGEPFSVASQVRWVQQTGFASFSVSRNGVLAYRQGNPVLNRFQLFWFDRRGKRAGPVGDPADYSNPALSPDGNRLAVGLGDPQKGTRDIWVFDLKRETSSRLTFDPADDTNPAWSPDGGRIFLTSNRRGHRDIYQKPANGLGAAQPVLVSDQTKSVDDVSPDGRFIAYDTGGEGPSLGIWILPLFSQRKPQPLVEGSFHANQARFSPNGRYLAYRSDESGKWEVYVQTFPEPRGKWQVSKGGGLQPLWGYDGKELFYLVGNKVMTVAVNTESAQFEMGIPKPLFETPIAGKEGRSSYCVPPGSQRFLINSPVEPPKETPSPITVVVNWTSEARR